MRKPREWVVWLALRFLLRPEQLTLLCSWLCGAKPGMGQGHNSLEAQAVVAEKVEGLGWTAGNQEGAGE